MILDLIRVLPVALLVVIVPGWCWSRFLVGSDDLAERLTYSLALSVTLVSAVALAEVRILGSGLTLPLAILSVVIVFLSGLAVYVGFGAAKEKKETMVFRPTLPGFAPLVPITLALGVVLGADLLFSGSFWQARSCWGWFSEPCISTGPIRWVTLPVALLLLLAGILYFFASRREEEHQPRPDEENLEERLEESLNLRPNRLSGLARRFALPAVILAVLVRGYLGPILHDWPFIRGVDNYSHAVMTNLMLTKGQIQPYLVYPPGFHLLTAEVSRLSGGVDPLRIFPILGPAFLLLPTLSCYVLARRLWGWEYGVVAAFLAGGLLGGSYYFFDDAMYPNMITSQLLLVMAVAALIRLYAVPSVRHGLLLALLGSSAVLYHQVSSMYVILLLAFVSLLILPNLLLRDRRTGIVLFLSLALMFVLAVPYAWSTYDLPQIFAKVFEGGKSTATGSAVSMAIGTQNPYPIEGLIGAIVSQPIAWLGLLGTFFLISAKSSWGYRPRSLAHFTLLLWILILFVGSRTTYSAFPQRFGRDLGIPLSILGALALIMVFRSLVKLRRPLAIYTASVAILLMVGVMGLRAVQSYAQAIGPSAELTTNSKIQVAGDWLKDHNRGGNIMVSPQSNQVPSRMMLAMGHYSAMQSFTQYQISNPRDLPPDYSPQRYQDELWVMYHPEGRQTQQILKKYDIRYIVLYKSMPDRPVVPYWQLFKARPDLYRMAFENSDVLIVAPRKAPAVQEQAQVSKILNRTHTP